MNESTLTDIFIASLDFKRMEKWFKKLDVTESEIAELGPSEALKQGILRRNEKVKNARIHRTNQ